MKNRYNIWDKKVIEGIILNNITKMETNELQVEAIKWYNLEKNTIIEKLSSIKPWFDRYKDYQNRVREIDQIIIEIIKLDLGLTK